MLTWTVAYRRYNHIVELCPLTKLADLLVMAFYILLFTTWLHGLEM